MTEEKKERKFKVGDKVKNTVFPDYTGTVVYIEPYGGDRRPYDVVLDDFKRGHNGSAKGTRAKNHWWFKEEELELVKPKMKFKVGDKVRFCRKLSVGEPLGCLGVVDDIDCDTSYDVIFENFDGGHDGNKWDNSNNHWYCNDDDLEFAEINEAVSSNPHYDTSIQPIETMQANMTPEEFLGYLKGNIIKYACRCGRKDEPLKEAKKIKEYAGWLVDALEGKKIDPRAN